MESSSLVHFLTLLVQDPHPQSICNWVLYLKRCKTPPCLVIESQTTRLKCLSLSYIEEQMEIRWRFSCLSLHKDPSAGSHWFGGSCEKMDTQSEGGICPDLSFSSSTGICRLVMPRFGPLISVLVLKRQVQKILQLIYSLFPPPLQLKWQNHRTQRWSLSAPLAKSNPQKQPVWLQPFPHP